MSFYSNISSLVSSPPAIPRSLSLYAEFQQDDLEVIEVTASEPVEESEVGSDLLFLANPASIKKCK